MKKETFKLISALTCTVVLGIARYKLIEQYLSDDARECVALRRAADKAARQGNWLQCGARSINASLKYTYLSEAEKKLVDKISH